MEDKSETALEALEQLARRPIPLEVEERAVTIFRHNFVMAVAARNMKVPGHSEQVWPSTLPKAASATRIQDGNRVPTEIAVFDNSLMMGARAQHDESPRAVSHFGSTVLPALIAAAETRKSTGREILSAMIVGYEVGDRVGSALVKDATSHGFRPTGLFGPIASAAAVASLLELDEPQWISAVALACNMAAGLSETWRAGTDEWKYQTALAAKNGYTAALLASDGVLGARTTLEAPRGFEYAYTGARESLCVKYDDDWAITRVNLKLYPVCVFNQAPVQQTLDIVGHTPNAEIASIEVVMHPQAADYPGVSTVDPSPTRAARLMSLPFCVATVALHREMRISDLEGPVGSEVSVLAKKVTIVRDDSLATHETRVTLCWLDGSTSSAQGPLRVNEEELLRSYAALSSLTDLRHSEFDSLLELLNQLRNLPSLDPVLDAARPLMNS